MNQTRVLKRIVLSTKNYDLMERKKFVFEVDWNTNKDEVRSAFQNIFGVKATAVNILRKKAKKKRRGRFIGLTDRKKRAIITIAPDQNFNFLEQNDVAAETKQEKSATEKKSPGFFERLANRFDNLLKVDAKVFEEDDKKKDKKNK